MLECTFWDVEHGSAATIKTPNGKYVQIDLGVGSYGDNNATFSPLRHLKYRWGVRQLAAIIISHPHKDHVDDIHNFSELSPGIIYRPNHLSENDIRSSSRGGYCSTIEKYL